MALINCPECGKNVSDTIESCIHCGYVLKKTEEEISKSVAVKQESIDEISNPSHKFNNETLNINNELNDDNEEKDKKFQTGIIISVIAAVLLLICICASGTATTEMPVTDIDLNTVRTELLSNEFATQEKYENQRYKVTNIAVVDEIREDCVVVLIPNNYSTLYVQLRYNSSELDFVRQLKRFDYVSFEGTLTELRTGGLWMYFKDVVFIDKA